MVFRPEHLRDRGFPLSRNFWMRTQVNKIETMYERPNVNVKVEGDSTFTFTLVMCALYTMSLFLFRYVRFNYAEVEIHLK